MTTIQKYRKDWDNLAEKNPMWAILTEKKKWNRKNFIETGKKEIIKLFSNLRRNKIRVDYEKALDFGCGIGRLTQALCPLFSKVVGIDISRQMIKMANESNKYKSKCEYILNDSSNLKLFKDNSFSFIYSSITLQHCNPKLIYGYIKEFVRILKKGGICVFQLPSHPANTIKGLIIRITPSFILDHIRKMEMHGINKDKIINLLLASKVKILFIKKDSRKQKHFIGEGWESYKYFFEK